MKMKFICDNNKQSDHFPKCLLAEVLWATAIETTVLKGGALGSIPSPLTITGQMDPTDAEQPVALWSPPDYRKLPRMGRAAAVSPHTIAGL